MNTLYDLVNEIRREASTYRTKYHPDYQRAGGMERAATMLESELNKQYRYATGEIPHVGDTVSAGGDQFRVDRIDFRKGIIQGAVDPVGYSPSVCYLIERG